MTQKTGTTGTRSSVLLAFAAVYIIWGSTYLGIRFALESIPPFLMAGFRFLIAGLILYAVQRARGAPRPTLQHWRSTSLIGVGMVVLGNGCVVWAEQRIPSGIAALVVAVTPCWMLLLDWLWERNARPKLMVVVGLLLGFGGIALLIGPGITTGTGVDPLGVLAVMLGAAGWAVGSIYSKRATLPEPQLLATGMEMLTGGVMLVVFSALIDELFHFHPYDVTLRSFAAFSYLIVFGSLVAFSAYLWLLRQVSAARVSTYAYVNPIVAVILGWALAGEALDARMGVAAVVIVAGVVLITMFGRKEAH